MMIVLSLWVLSGSLLAEEAPANEVPNFSVEQAEDGQPAGWKFSSWKESQGEWNDEFCFEGEKSLKLSGMNGGWNTQIPVDGKRVYQLSFRYRSVGGPSTIVAYVRDLAAEKEKRVLLYHTEPAVPASTRSRFVDGQYVEGADENGWVHFDAGSFVSREEMGPASLLVKLVSENPEATAWLDAFEIKVLPQREVPDTARILTRVEGATIWQESENRKIFPDTDLPSEKTKGPVKMDLAQGEYASFQIAVTPDVKWTRVDWKWEDFSAADLSMRCRRVESIPIDHVHGPFGTSGLTPDPLTEKLPCDIAAGTHQAFWFTVFAPIGHEPGRYRNSLILSSGDGEICRVPVEILVRDFSLPQQPSIDVHSGFRASLVRRAESGDMDDVIKRYYRSYFEHRTRCAPAVSVGVRVAGEKVEVDAAKFIEHLKFINDSYGARPFFLPSLWISHEGHKMPADAKWKGLTIFANAELTKLEPEFESRFTDYMRQLVSATKAADLFHDPIVRFIDEPDLNDTTTIHGIHTIASLLTKIDPAITVSLTATRPQPELTDVIRSWTLHTDAWDRNLPLIAAAREKGCRISVYNNGVNYPENDPIRIRLWPWLLKKYDVDGSNSWWGTVCWRGDVEKPWTSGKTTSGVLLYPPRDDTEHGPIESVRWELFRQGLQDYEYLHLAEKLAGDLEAEGKGDRARVGREAIQEALSLVERWPRVRPANDQPYTLDVTRLDAARTALADAIEAMK